MPSTCTARSEILQAARRFLLRGRVGRENAVRPPGLSNEAHFTSTCDGCGLCVSACPDGLIGIIDGFPELDFARGECSRCARCVEACPQPALQAAAMSPPHYTATIGPACLAVAGIDCRVCSEQCATGAIRFAVAARGIRIPLLDETQCNACGACWTPCPARAIAFIPTTECQS